MLMRGARQRSGSDVDSWSAVLFGAAPDSGNLGVEALSASVIHGLRDRAPDAQLTVFDNGLGLRPGRLDGPGPHARFDRCGARLTRRRYRPESLRSMHLMAGMRPGPSEGLRRIQRAAAVLDVSGGDSFTDMYGPRRFQMIALPKQIALRAGRPLVLLPQTYGPFRGEQTRATATSLVRGAAQAWARDAESHQRLVEMLGADHDPTRHRLGIDMAFGLAPAAPSTVPESLDAWLDEDVPVAGVNVSGLLWAESSAAITRDELSVDYAELVIGLVDRLVADGARVLLVPHVIGSSPESDLAALADLATRRRWPDDAVRVLPSGGLTAATAKWWIGRCDWFVGSRMHSTIAALGSGVPTAALAYSLKTRPVFATVGQADRVIDGRSASTGDALDHLYESWQRRREAAEDLARRLPDITAQVQDQMDRIVADAGACS